MDLNKCNEIIEKLCNNKKIHELIVLIENLDGSFSWDRGYNKVKDSPMLMASITKLFTTTCILILKEQGRISFEDRLSIYLDNDLLDGIHVYKGKEYSYELTIYDLLFQVSGLPDYFLNGDEPFEKKF